MKRCLSFSIEGDGVVAGEATCESGGWGGGFSGPVTATAIEGVLAGTWSLDLGWGNVVDVPFAGEVGDGVATVAMDYGMDWGTIYGDGEAARE